MSVCYDINDWKWPGIVNALTKYDKDNTIIKTILTEKKIEKEFDHRDQLIIGISKMDQLTFRKGKEYSYIMENHDMTVIEKAMPKYLTKVAKLMHFIAFSHQNSTSSYRLKNYLKEIWKAQLGLRLLDENLTQIGQTLENNICKELIAGSQYINLSEQCLEWNEGNCKSLSLGRNLTTFENWCKECFSKNCLSKRLYFKNNLVFMILVDRYINKQNVIDLFMSRLIGRSPDGQFAEVLFDLDGPDTNLKSVQAWTQLNGGIEDIDDILVQKVTKMQNNYSQFQAEPKLLKDLLQLFAKPDKHGNNQKDWAMIPLCSFRKRRMETCNLFKDSVYNFAKKRCFTFNGNHSNYFKGGMIEHDLGLNMFVSFRIPKVMRPKKAKNVQLILHEPGVVPDLHYRTNTYTKIEPGHHYLIGAQASIMEITDAFKDLSLKKRSCNLNPEGGMYHQTNCYFDRFVQEGVKRCQCIPWYMYDSNSTAKTCVAGEFRCFEEIVKNGTEQSKIDQECLNACNFIKYTSFVLEKDVFEKEKYDYDEIRADGFGSLLDDPDPKIHPYQSIVQINFLDPYATEILQDAKVTFADMVGSIGGTFGVFLGLSFVSLVDELVEWIEWCMKKNRK